MSPIKSSLAKTAKQLLGLRNTADLGLRGATQKSKKVFTYILSVPTAVNSPGKWDLAVDGTLVLGTGTYDIAYAPGNIDSTVNAAIHMWGGGGGAGTPGGYSPGGAGGHSSANFAFASGTTYKFVVGTSQGGGVPGGNTGAPGNGASSAGHGGGYTGMFATSVAHGNAIMIAGGGGGSSGDTIQRSVGGAGGSGGGPEGIDGSDGNSAPGSGGDRGTQVGGGPGGPGYSGGTPGGALYGGNGGAQGNGGDGGGGGAGYYGGGGGGGTDPAPQGGGGGGGGSGYIGSPLLIGAVSVSSPGPGRAGSSPYAPLLPASAGRGNTRTDGLGLGDANDGGDGAVIIAAV